MKETDKLEVLYVEPMKKARFIKIDDNLKSMQELVEGNIQEYMPFEDEVALICNEEGKMNNLAFNRAIFDKNGVLLDIIQGSFFLCYAPVDSEKYLPLPDGIRQKYEKMFKDPELFHRTKKGVLVRTILSKEPEQER